MNSFKCLQRSVIALIVSLCCIVIGVAYAQTNYDLSGRVVSSIGNPIPFATIQVESKTGGEAVTGGIADEQGEFALTIQLPQSIDQYLLKVSSLGYETLENVQIEVGKPMVITLQEVNYELGDVTIKPKERSVRLRQNGWEIDAKRFGIDGFGTIFDALSNVPGLTVKDEQVTVLGRGTPKIYVNGRLLQDNSMLYQYDLQRITKIRVITNPGANYPVETTSVIEIDIKDPNEGLGGLLRATAQHGRRFSHREYLSLVYRKGAIDLFVMANNDVKQRLGDTEVKMKLPEKYDTDLITHVDQSKKTISQYIVSGINFTISEKHKLGMQYDYTRTPQFLINSAIATDVIKSTGNRRENQESHYRNDNSYHNINAYYYGSLTNSWRVRYDTDLLWHNDRALNSFTIDKNGSIQEHNTDLRQRSRLVSGRLQNFWTLPGGELNFGGEFALTKNAQSHEATLNTLNQGTSEIKNQLYGLFTSYSHHWAGDWGLFGGELGLRYEYNTFGYLENGMEVKDQTKDYHVLAPTIQGFYQKDDLAASLSYKMTTQRPSYHQLSDRHQYNNEYLYEGGNKYLLPSLTQLLSLQTQWKQLMVGVEYKHVKDMISFNTSYVDKLGVALSKPINIPSSHFFSLQAMWSYQLGFWQPTWQLMAQKPIVRYQGQDYSKPSLTIIAKDILSYSFKNFNVGANAMYFTGGSNGLSNISSFYKVDLYANASFLDKKLRVSLVCDDIFASSNATATMFNNGLKTSFFENSDSRQVRLTITYNLPRKKNRYDGESSSSEIGRIL